MEKRYSTDLSDDEWECLELHLPPPTSEDAPGPAAPVRSSTPSSTSSRAAAPGGCCPRTFRLGRPSTGGSADGERTAPSSGSTTPCASVYGPAWAGTRCLARA